MVKTYILDTNTLILTGGTILDHLCSTDNNVVIPFTVLAELDNHKKDPGERGYSVRESIRKIFAFKDEEGSFTKGVRTLGGGTFRIEMNHIEGEDLPNDWDMTKPDNKILSTAMHLFKHLDEKTVLITNDAGMYLNACLIGLPVQNYKADQIDEDDLYTGRTILPVKEEVLETLYKEKTLPLTKVFSKKVCKTLFPNEFITITCGNQAPPCFIDTTGQWISLLPEEKTYGGICGRNTGQRFMLHALLAPAEEIPLVILNGPAGTGKTYLAIAAGLEKVYDDKKYASYDSLVITRTNVQIDFSELGILPGNIRDKMSPLLYPLEDNLKSILKGADGIEDPEQIRIQIEDMYTTGIIELCPFGYLRGRSIPNSYIIVDEAQNMTVEQMRTLVTRCGVGTKLVIAGDPDQVDAPHLSKRSNGLVYLCEKMKGNPLCAQVTMKDSECVRSPLAMEAARLL